MSKKQKQHQTTVPGNPLAVNVVGTQREDLAFALKSWKRKVKASGVLEKVKERSHRVMAGNPAGFPRRKEKEEEMSNILVVDSSWLMHRSKHTIGDILSHNDMKTGVMFGFFWSIFKFCKEYKTSKLIFCFDSKENLRKSCYTGYKSSRNSSDKTEFERLMDDAAYDQFNLIPKLLQQLGFRHLYRRRGYESDDLIASICMSNPKFKDSFLK